MLISHSPPTAKKATIAHIAAPKAPTFSAMLATHVKAKPPAAVAAEPEPEDPRDSEDDCSSTDSEQTAAEDSLSEEEDPAYSTRSRYTTSYKPAQHRELLAKKPNEVARLTALANISQRWGTGVERVLHESMQPKVETEVEEEVEGEEGMERKKVARWVVKSPENWPRRMLEGLANISRLQMSTQEVNRRLAAKVNARLNRTGKWGPKFEVVRVDEVVQLYDELVKAGVRCKAQDGSAYAFASGGMEAVMEESEAE